MKPRAFLSILVGFGFSACINRPVVYTGTQFSAHAQGIKNSYPEKISIGYDRGEYAWLPNGGASSVKGAFDSEFANTRGLAISELLATGEAAGGNKPVSVSKQPMIVSTTTKFNLGLEAIGSDGAAPSINAGYKRSVLSLFPRSEGDLPSTYTDLSIHASGYRGDKIANPKGILSSKRHLKGSNGVRVVQTIATGEAATRLGHTGRNGAAGKELNDRIRNGLGQSTNNGG